MTAIAKNPPYNLFEKMPGGKKEKKYLLDPGLGGTPTQSRDIQKIHGGLFPRIKSFMSPFASDPLMSVVTQGSARAAGGGPDRRRHRRPRGRQANILTGQRPLGTPTTEQRGLRTTFG